MGAAVLGARVGTRPSLGGRRAARPGPPHGDSVLACHGVEPGAVLRQRAPRLASGAMVTLGRESPLAAVVGRALCPRRGVGLWLGGPDRAVGAASPAPPQASTAPRGVRRRRFWAKPGGGGGAGGGCWGRLRRPGLWGTCLA